MTPEHNRTANLLGALALALTDLLTDSVEASGGHGGAAPAALVTIGSEPELSVSVLGQILGLSQPGAARLVERLVADGLVQRGPGPDARTHALTLTAAGQERRAAILVARAAQLAPALATLSPTEQAQLTPLLERMLQTLTTDLRRSYAICRLCDEAVCATPRCPVDAACEREEAG
jgi:MarR family transcriptional repressor of emrRAB